jgi:hypothetical protein
VKNLIIRRKDLMNTLTKLSTIAGLALAFSTSASADITWTFNTTTFCLNCGQTDELNNDIAAGSFFTTDDAATTVTGWDIVVEGTNPAADNEYTNSVSGNGFIFPDANHLDFFSPGFVNYLDLFLDSPGITIAGGTVNLLQGDLGASGNSTIACNGCSTLVSGSVVGSTVPEPRFGAVLLVGLASLGFFARRKFAVARS